MKNMSLMVGPPSDRLDPIMYRFIGVWPISVAAVFRRRSRHGHYMMTNITAVQGNALLHAFHYNSDSV